MIRYFKNYKWPENLEILFMLIVGIFLQMTDGSPFSMKDRWSLVWDIELPVEYFSVIAQKIIKTIITMIIIVRCSTTYAYVVSAMLVIFCLLKKTTPKLMLPWLSVAGVKSICMTFLEALAGVYVCSAFGKIRKACIEFFISKALEIIFAAYLWGNVLSIYQDMENKAKDEANFSSKDVLFSSFSRQRARSLLDESTLYKTACLNNFEFKDVPQIILQMLKRDDEMSQDSLLDPGMMLASVSNLGSFDNLKASQSLGELGFMDLKTTQVVGLEEDENLPLREKVLKFLRLTKSDVARIKLNKSTVENNIYTVDDDIWARVIASGTHINKPKQARTEVFVREIPQPEETVTKRKNQPKVDMKFDFTFSHLLIGKQGEFPDYQDEDSLIFSQDEEEGKNDEEIFRMFMSNIKEGVVINRYGLGFGLKIMKGTQYEKLYKQDFMSKIGPEVFERATNLPKVTSFTKIIRNSVSLPEMKELLQTNGKKNISQKDSTGDIDQTSSLDLYSGDPEFSKKQIFPAESFSKEKIEKIVEGTSVGDEFMTDRPFQVKPEETENESTKLLEDEHLKSKSDTDSSDSNKAPKMKDKINHPSPNLSIKNFDNVKEAKPCFKKRRILIKRKGKQRTAQVQKLSFDNYCSPRNPESGFNHQIISQVRYGKENAENIYESNMMLSSLENSTQNNHYANDKKFSSVRNNEMYFLTETLEKPHWKVSITYYDLCEKAHLQNKVEARSQEPETKFLSSQFTSYRKRCEEVLDSLKTGPKEKKIWKSNVLKIVETYFMPKYLHTFEPSLKNLRVLKKLIKTEHLYLPNKLESFFEKENVSSASGFNGENYERRFTASVKRNLDVTQDPENDINIKLMSKPTKAASFNYGMNTETFDTYASTLNKSEESERNSDISASEYYFKKTYVDFVSRKNSKLVITSDDDSELSETEVMTNYTDKRIKVQMEDGFNETDIKAKLNLITGSKAFAKEDSFSSQESDEPISLYYSRAANLASPLLDMKRFIYPDHIHYSYKHVKKKGFDVNINGGFPLLVRENLSISSSLDLENESTSKSPEPEIKRRPMDLSFAMTNAFADWQNNCLNDTETNQNQAIKNTFLTKRKPEPLDNGFIQNSKTKKLKYFKKILERKENRASNGIIKPKPKPYGKNFNDVTFINCAKDYILIEKLLRMHMQFNKNEYSHFESRTNERAPVQISSTQLHSNKGRKNPIKNPVVLLQKNKTRGEKKKVETQEERTKDMFARLAKEAFLRNSNAFTSLGSKKNS